MTDITVQSETTTEPGSGSAKPPRPVAPKDHHASSEPAVAGPPRPRPQDQQVSDEPVDAGRDGDAEETAADEAGDSAAVTVPGQRKPAQAGGRKPAPADGKKDDPRLTRPPRPVTPSDHHASSEPAGDAVPPRRPAPADSRPS
ncbi:hypothetical protein RM780_00020 [Streptomyces sp. DSM 44917]|uniref:Uncharacterized protein n=1 Tax=Streptomyces boetiae TaxID=3075541 RepID=A0ABU2L1R9_9ACTN|nr:hypothetical protein [Streptomyces sp. DSM 44917]MDT0305351.1 hypothetical protein [Streptomyces sp. DSM 44917]